MLLNRTIRVLAASTIFFASAAQAEEAVTAGRQPTSERTPSAASDVLGSTSSVGAETVPAQAAEEVSDDELQELRGGESIVVGNQTLLAITSGNIINGNYTAGNVTLSDNALSNFNGLGNVLINTGAQVSLQTGMNVTINVGD